MSVVQNEPGKVWIFIQRSLSSLYAASKERRTCGIWLKYAWREKYALMGKPVRVAPFEYEFEQNHASFLSLCAM